MPPTSEWWASEQAQPASLILEVDRLDDVDVGQVHAVGDVRIVEDVDVAGRHAALEVAHEAGHGVVEGAQMHGRGEPLRQRLAAVVEDGGGEIHGVADDAGIGRAHEVERHVVGDGVEAALQNLEQEGIDVAAHGAAHMRDDREVDEDVAVGIARGGRVGRHDDRALVFLDHQRPWRGLLRRAGSWK